MTPRSKPKYSGATRGLGVGGTRVCAIPAPIEIAPTMYPIPLLSFFIRATPIGIRITNVTSKNTGIDRINPANPTAYIAYFSGNRETSLSAITVAPPVSLTNCPRMIPRPIGKPMLPIMFPKPLLITVIRPFVTVPSAAVISLSGTLVSTPRSREPRISAIAGFIFTFVQKRTTRAIEMIRQMIKYVADIIFPLH